jgi:hypothetical protein
LYHPPATNFGDAVGAAVKFIDESLCYSHRPLGFPPFDHDGPQLVYPPVLVVVSLKLSLLDFGYNQPIH